LHGPAYIDPMWGYIISEQGYILEDSICCNSEYPKRPFAISVPSPFHFFKAVRKETKVIEMDTAISLRHFWEWNYYHFYFDVLGKLELLHTVGVDDTLPLVLAKYADDVSFVRPLIERGKFKDRNWITPTSEYIKAEKILFCRTKRPYRERILYILDSLQIEETADHEERRIYLSRSGTRRLVNLKEIEPILEKHSFDVVDSAKMSIDEQISLFSKTRYIVANHGAGTTNILFRGEKPLSLLEVHHEQLFNLDHKRICDEFGHFWDDLEGKKGQGIPSRAHFTINLEQLEQKIVKLLTT